MHIQLEMILTFLIYFLYFFRDSDMKLGTHSLMKEKMAFHEQLIVHFHALIIILQNSLMRTWFHNLEIFRESMEGMFHVGYQSYELNTLLSYQNLDQTAIKK